MKNKMNISFSSLALLSVAAGTETFGAVLSSVELSCAARDRDQTQDSSRLKCSAERVAVTQDINTPCTSRLACFLGSTIMWTMLCTVIIGLITVK